MAKKMKPIDELTQAAHGGKGTVTFSQPVGTSTRCRATHDVPYRLRCVLDASHTIPIVLANRPGYSMVRDHEDKEGNRW